jgi:HK97 family phage portal protein
MAFWDKILKKQKYQYVSEGNYNKPFWTTQKDKQYITEAYNKVVWVYSCVMQISSATSSVPWLLYRKGLRGRLIEIESHPILEILNNKANSFMSGRDLLDLWATYLAIEGKFYGEYINPNLPTAIVPLYPHYMKPIPSKEEFVSGYQYDMFKPIYYNREEVLWSKFNDPLEIYDGLSPIKALSRTIDTENEAVNWNKSTLQNSGVPAGIFTIQNPSPELMDNLRDEWRKRYGGGNNARLPLVLNADRATYQPIGLSSVDMDFLNQRKLNRTEICSAFGVPSQLVGDPEGQTYSNFSEAVKSFWENTIIPRYLEHIKDKLNSDLVSRYADNLVLTYDLSGVSALKESQDSLTKRTIDLWKNGLIKRNEARFALEYEDVQDGDVFFNELTGMTPNPVDSDTEQKDMNAKKNSLSSLSESEIHFMLK